MFGRNANFIASFLPDNGIQITKCTYKGTDVSEISQADFLELTKTPGMTATISVGHPEQDVNPKIF